MSYHGTLARPYLSKCKRKPATRRALRWAGPLNALQRLHTKAALFFVPYIDYLLFASSDGAAMSGNPSSRSAHISNKQRPDKRTMNTKKSTGHSSRKTRVCFLQIGRARVSNPHSGKLPAVWGHTDSCGLARTQRRYIILANYFTLLRGIFLYHNSQLSKSWIGQLIVNSCR